MGPLALMGPSRLAISHTHSYCRTVPVAASLCMPCSPIPPPGSHVLFWNRVGWLIMITLWMMTMHMQENTFFQWGPSKTLYVFGVQIKDARHYVFVLLMIAVDRLSDLRPVAGPDPMSPPWGCRRDGGMEAVAVVYGQVNLLWRINMFAQIDLFLSMVVCDLVALCFRQLYNQRTYAQYFRVGMLVAGGAMLMFVYWLVSYIGLDRPLSDGYHPAPLVPTDR